ncbi:mannose-1-phosphate guanylyltransferase/mannose-6-phosphate isomerase [Prochlorococcus marinus XMU1410]|uniref:mannose-1-phosphate guanylyltransferase/mannose-6-phosphate isomerase n=1 Tax=Prochlorococcus marinus TaxID=1219 RepID=UPI001AD9FA6B|nr:mannose-1-phosphate guanylyltransferase/mannose-6-phosphate isomerase [Prochlorococcus marinus]MBO8242341.1 mannose-1-phosphate guanylyltransferase/mannose-6-phosphate isomerase [Prochlorococcus marinus XMU1410]MBW3053488.1 mannose-1-phosphate guanylyltransferase/mannose-6-phosphate isomerase [Prochlorococcus marinus str. MU1410]
MNAQPNLKILPIILSGGVGTRIWPLSRESFPKQFWNLHDENGLSLLQKTIERLKPLEDLLDPIIICNEEHRFLVAEQCRKININPSRIILEPFGKGTAPAILAAALSTLNELEDVNLLVLSSDHVITNEDQFLKAIKFARNQSEKGNIVTFGVVPNRPEVGYGYIKVDRLSFPDNLQSQKIEKFIEKPSLNKAKEFLLEGKYLWNSGIFMFKSSTIISESEKYFNSNLEILRAAIENSKKDMDFLRIDKNNFMKCENISIDIALIEKTLLAVVVPLDSGWSDIGNWFSLWQSSKKDKNNNATKGRVVSKDNKNCLIRSEHRLIVAMGLKDIVVVETDDVVLVSDIKQSQEIKKIVNDLKNDGVSETQSHSEVYRPWGNYRSMLEGERWQVKIIRVKPGASLSLQMHHHRAEHWIVVKGTADVEINEKNILLTENQSIHIPLGSKHRLSNPGKLTLEMIEVQSGPYLDEDDIIRFNDKYGRK